MAVALVSIGSGLSMTKEYRGVFEDLIEKVRQCRHVRVAEEGGQDAPCHVLRVSATNNICEKGGVSSLVVARLTSRKDREKK